MRAVDRGHYGALDIGQQAQCQDQRDWQPDRQLHPGRRMGIAFQHQEAGDDDVTDDGDGEIGRRIVGAQRLKGQGADGALLADGEVALEHGGSAAARTFPAPAARQGGGPFRGAGKRRHQGGSFQFQGRPVTKNARP